MDKSKADPKQRVTIKNVDMSEEMQQDAQDIGCAAVEKFRAEQLLEKDIAAHIKKEFDKKHGATWHCIVGRSFGSYVTHESKHFVYFYVDKIAILLFKAG